MNDVMRTNHRRAQTLIYKLDAATDAMSTNKVAGPLCEPFEGGRRSIVALSHCIWR